MEVKVAVLVVGRSVEGRGVVWSGESERVDVWC